MNHPADVVLADYLDKRLSSRDKEEVERHVASCDECLIKMASTYESVESFNKRKTKPMKKINYYLILAIITFTLSFVLPRYFLQSLVATLLLGVKWITDSKTTKMLIMIHEAWKNEGPQGASEVIKRFDSNIKTRI